MDLRAWWRVMRTRCSPLATHEPLASGELTARVAAALSWIAPAQRLALPARFDAYLDLLASTTWYGHHVALDFLLYSPRSIATSAESDTPERHDDHELARQAGLWIAIGSIGDKHEYFLCVDRDRPTCGRVFDAHDDHPYLNGTSGLYDLGKFEDWLADVETMRKRRSGGHLIALTAEERVELDPVQDDPWALVVAARDLQYRLVPDPAWAHAAGEPERIVVVSKAPQIETLVDDGDALVAFVPPGALADFQVHDVPKLRTFASAMGGVLFVR